MSQKISTHVFHSLYLFDRDESKEKYVKNGKPTHLLANWPIFNRIPTAIIEGGSVQKYSNIKEYFKLTDKKDRDQESMGRNYITIPMRKFSSHRGLFHGMLKGVKVSHDADFTIDGTSDGVRDRTCCKDTPNLTATAVYEGNGGHCCDRAVFGFYVDDSRIGTINLNNGGDCGSRSSGPFSIPASSLSKRRFPIEITCENNGNCHNGVTVVEIKRPDGSLAGSRGLSEGESCLEVCDQPDNDFSEDLCCCPPLHVKKDENNTPTNNGDPCGGEEYTEVQGYECNRFHSKTSTFNFEIDTVDIFGLSNLGSNIDANRILVINNTEPILETGKPINTLGEYESNSAPGNFPTDIPPSSSRCISRAPDVQPPVPSPSPTPDEPPAPPCSDFIDGFNKALVDDDIFLDHVDSTFSASTSSQSINNFYKDNWSFDSATYKSVLNNKSMSKYALVKDPVIGYEDSVLGYRYTFMAPVENDKTNFLSQSLRYSFSKFHSMTVQMRTDGMHHHDVSDEFDISDIISYISEGYVNHGFYSEDNGEYYLFINFSASFLPGKTYNVHWDAGDYEDAMHVTGPDGDEDRSDSDCLEWSKEYDFTRPTYSPLFIGTDPRHVLGPKALDDWSPLKSERGAWIKTFSVPVILDIAGNPGGSPDIECFKFEDEQATSPDPSSSSSSSQDSCKIDLSLTSNWSHMVSITVMSYKDEDFSNQLLLKRI
jgi:hypothetical protein